MAETIGECINDNNAYVESNIEEQENIKADLEALKSVLESMIPNLAGFDDFIEDIKSSPYTVTEEEIIQDIMSVSVRLVIKAERTGHEDDIIGFVDGYESLYDGGYGNLNGLLNQNPGFKSLYSQYREKEAQVVNGNQITNNAVQELADCLREVNYD